MKKGDVQLGLPVVLYQDTQANIEALVDVEGSFAYATDINAFGSNNGADWGWLKIDGAFTLTIPATGTAALLATANVFSVAQSILVTDAVTNLYSNVLALRHSSTGTPVAGFGVGLFFQAATDTVADRDQALIRSLWTDPIDASRTSALYFYTRYNGGALTANMTMDGQGNINLLGAIVTPGFTTRLSAAFGALGLQSYSVNNAWISNNSYFDGGSFRYIEDGFSVMHRFLNGGLDIQTAPSGLAGAVATMTQRFSILNTGNIGIGIAAPTAKLHINVNSTTAFLVEQDGVNDDTFLVDTANGRVGVNTAPSTTLDVYVSALAGQVRIGQSDNLLYIASPAATKAAISFAQTGQGIWRLGVPASSGNFHFDPSSVDFTTSKLVITSDGKVGIGILVPTSILHIEAATASQKIKSTTGTNTVLLQFLNTSGQFLVGLENSSGGGAIVGGLAYAAVLNQQTNFELQFGTNNTARMTILRTGLIGIGITAPTSLLHVVGSTDIIQLIVKANATQTANIATWETSAAGLLVSIQGVGTITQTGAVGSIVIGDSNGLGTNNGNGIFFTRDGANYLRASGGSSASIQLFVASNIAIHAASSGRIVVGSSAVLGQFSVYSLLSTRVGIVVQGISAQSSDLFQAQDDSANILALITAGGGAVFNEQGIATADFRVESDAYDALFVDASNDSVMLMSNAAGKVGFFGVTAVIQQTELTDELTTLTFSAPGTPDYAIQDLIAATGFGFVTADEGQTVLSVIANLQARVNELETKLVAYGLLVDVD